MLWLLADLLVRSTIILGTATLLCRFLKGLRPAQRHGILLSAFALLLLWPLLASILPEIAIPIWPRPLTKSAISAQQIAVSYQIRPKHNIRVSPVLLWAAAAAMALWPLLGAHFRLRSLLRNAVPNTDAGWMGLAEELSRQLRLPRTPTLLIHPEPLMPMTFGWRRACVILPGDCHGWTASRRRIVLLHELAHIARRDLLAQCCARLVAACWWFQPLSWSTLRWLRRESERSCDELVIASGVRPSDYATELLAIAQTFAMRQRMSAAVIGVAHQHGLEGRLRSILQLQGAPIDRSVGFSIRWFTGIALLAALTLAASAVTLFPASQPLSPRGHTMKHSLFAGLLASAGLSAATIGGSLYDPSGAAVPNAKALLYDPDTNSKFETTTAPDGKFAFETLPAGQYILRVQKPGFATLFREFNVKNDAKVDRGFTLTLGLAHEELTVAAAGTPALAAPSVEKQIRVGGEVAQLNLIRKVQPVYPSAAKAAGLQGAVVLDTVISAAGEPLDIRVISSPGEDFTQSTLEAVRQWRYKPTLLNGNPVEIITEILVNYTLSR